MKHIFTVNKSLSRPILIAGIPKKLLCINLLLSFPLIAASHFKFPDVLLGAGLLIGLQVASKIISQDDLFLAAIITPNLKFNLIKFYPAIGVL